MAGVQERIRWQLKPWHREYIEQILPLIEYDYRSQELDRVKDDLKRCAVELFSLLPEVQFSEDGTEFTHPNGSTWTPIINRSPRRLEQIANELEDLSSRYLLIRVKCEYGMSYEDLLDP